MYVILIESVVYCLPRKRQVTFLFCAFGKSISMQRHRAIISHSALKPSELDPKIWLYSQAVKECATPKGT